MGLLTRSLIYQEPDIPVKFYQCLANTEVDARSHPLDRAQGPSGKELEKVPRGKG